MAPTDRAISFGPFRLLPAQRLLLEGDKPLRLGSRALDVLIALAERPGELVSKDELKAHVWPDTVVEDANLTVQIAALRRILGDGSGGNRYLATVVGRGYSFVAQVIREPARAPARPVCSTTPAHNLPVLLTRLVGRETVVRALAQQFSRLRLLTIAGSGGIGKTSVALAVAEVLINDYKDGVWLVDLAPIGDARLVPGALATVLGLEIRSDDPLPALINALRYKRTLIVLDNCEHVLDGAAALAIGVLRGAPEVQILATTREPLRVEGEHVHRLAPLDIPPASPLPIAEDARAFPAVQLFIERAAAIVDRLEFNDADIAIVVDICRRLDGIPLAIELAAARIGALGVHGIASRLEDRLRSLTQGRRGAPARQQTMQATLDWSHGLLNTSEQIVFRRLAIFVGGFTHPTANAVVADRVGDQGDITDQLLGLISKSMVATDVSGAEPRYRLLETTRAYALAKLKDSGEIGTVARRHAAYYQSHLETAGSARGETIADTWYAAYTPEIDNVRAALAWAFGSDRDAMTAVALAAASAPLLLGLSLLTECCRWMEAAISRLNETGAKGKRQEMILQAALGLSLMPTRGMTGDAHAALTRAAELAAELGDSAYRLQALNALYFFCIRVADFRGALKWACEFEAVAKIENDPATSRTAERLLGSAFCFLGDQSRARAHLDKALDGFAPPSGRAYLASFGLDHRVDALCSLANVLWLQGFPDQARSSALSSIDEALTIGHPVSLCMALAWGGGTFALRAGDLATAERLIASLIQHATAHSLDTYCTVGRCLQGQLSAQRGDVATGVRLLQTGLQILDKAAYRALYAVFLVNLADVLRAAGRGSEGLTAIGEALEIAERNEEAWHLPEILRIKGELLLQQDGSRVAVAEEQFLRSLDAARKQGALSWELRTATSLARLHRNARGRRDARKRLATLYGRFTEGFETEDLRAAKRLLDEPI